MSRRKQREDEGVSLFPFLSILACVIGVLTLLITALALGQMDNPEGHSAERAEKFARLQERIQELEIKIRQLQELAAKAQTVRQAAEELQRLKTEQGELAAIDDQAVALLAELNQLNDTIKRLQSDPDGIKKQLAELRAELKRRKAPPAAPRTVVRPAGSGVDIDPVFVECNATGLVVFEDGKPAHRIRRSDIASDKRFLQLLDQVAQNPKGRVIFLVRPDAVGTYNQARSVALSHFCPNGKLPVLTQGEIDLSQFYGR
ncbi:MAG: hypothetical protein D6725_05675 [Planctomycetota bacterium]|nr:MAG: hypothetical protein D6725_05675 [Planctomycetota bacterium]